MVKAKDCLEMASKKLHSVMASADISDPVHKVADAADDLRIAIEELVKKLEKCHDAQ